jgi:hypothetical protein
LRRDTVATAIFSPGACETRTEACSSSFAGGFAAINPAPLIEMDASHEKGFCCRGWPDADVTAGLEPKLE